MRDEGFNPRAEPSLISLVHAHNLGSIRVAQKNGFALRGELEFFGRTFKRYEITRAEWALSKIAAPQLPPSGEKQK